MDESTGKLLNCQSCGRPVRHRGFCLACNINKMKEKELIPDPNTSEIVVDIAAAKPSIEFPFSSVRAPQEEMINDIRNALANRRHLIADAPTGIGKTIAVLYPAVEYAIENKKTVFFLTSRLSQHKMAVETVQKLGVPAVDIIGKKWLCSHDVQDFDNSMFSNFCYSLVTRGQCRYYRNFRHKEITHGALSMINELAKKPVHSEDAKRLAGASYCTFELLMEAAKKSTAIIADYFHIFSPNITKFFKRINKQHADSIIIVDEAHNLPDRIRKDMSVKLTTRTIEIAKKENDRFGLGVGDYLRYVEESLSGMAKQKLVEAGESFAAKEDLVERIEGHCSCTEIINALAGAGEAVLKEKKKSFIERIAIFLESWLGQDFGYARIISRERIFGKDHIAVYYNCMDPSLVAENIVKESHSTILMSGTLSPGEMYRDLLGMDKERTDIRSYTSPFPRRNRLNIIADDITTEYKQRTPENYAKIARTVALCTGAIKGNAAVFFPSYKMMKEIHAIAKDRIQKQIFMEMQGMTKEERKKLQEDFAAQHEKGAALFGVLAGSFSEGIDLPGDKLNGVVVIGLPLEKPGLGVQALIDYYDKRFNRGKDYGYIYPAMRKVMQAAGRCIRSENDRGVCVFGDKRFSQRRFRYIFPQSWSFVNTERPEVEIINFFKNK